MAHLDSIMPFQILCIVVSLWHILVEMPPALDQARLC